MDTDPAVAAVEGLLRTVTPEAAVAGRTQRPWARVGFWFCGCLTDHDDSFVWLLYESADGQLGWMRLPDGLAEDDAIDAADLVGVHGWPSELLGWLSGEIREPTFYDELDRGADRLITERILNLVRPDLI